jgi:hypothetical protein
MKEYSKGLLSMAGVLAICMLPFAAASAQQPTEVVDAKAGFVEESPNGVYIIQMIDDPVVAYEGGIKGLKATKPKRGNKIDPNSPHVVNYVDYLNAKQEEALRKAGGGRKIYNYQFSFNGFAAELNYGQAKKLQAMENVVAVRPDELLVLDTATTPAFIGLETLTGCGIQECLAKM